MEQKETKAAKEAARQDRNQATSQTSFAWFEGKNSAIDLTQGWASRKDTYSATLRNLFRRVIFSKHLHRVLAKRGHVF